MAVHANATSIVSGDKYRQVRRKPLAGVKFRKPAARLRKPRFPRQVALFADGIALDRG